MEKKEKILFPNQVENEKFCRNVFEKTQIVPIDADYCCRIKIEGANILRMPCHRKFYSAKIVGFQLGIFSIIFRAHTDEVLFIYENKGNFEIFPWGVDGFWLKTEKDGNFVIESYKLEKDGWEKTVYPQNQIPEGYEEKRRVGSKHDWQMVKPYREGVKSIDNTIYYGYIVPSKK